MATTLVSPGCLPDKSALLYLCPLSTDERHRSVRDVLLLDGITAALTARASSAPAPLLIRTLATLATIPHYDPNLYDQVSAQILIRTAAANQNASSFGGRSDSCFSLSAGDAKSAILAFGKVQHQSKNGRLFLQKMMEMIEPVSSD